MAPWVPLAAGAGGWLDRVNRWVMQIVEAWRRYLTLGKVPGYLDYSSNSLSTLSILLGGPQNTLSWMEAGVKAKARHVSI